MVDEKTRIFLTSLTYKTIRTKLERWLFYLKYEGKEEENETQELAELKHIVLRQYEPKLKLKFNSDD